MMKKGIFILSTIAILFVACVKEDIYNTVNPTKTTLTIEPMLEGTSLASYPIDLYLFVDGKEINYYNKSNNSFLVDPGENKEILIYNKPSGISINNGIATYIKKTHEMTPLTLTKSRSNDSLRSDNIYYASIFHNLIADSHSTLNPVMIQGSANIEFELGLYVQEFGYTGIMFELDGVSESRDLCSGETFGSTTIVSQNQVGETDIETHLTPIKMNFNALGISKDEKQILTMTTLDHDGRIDKRTFDISSSFSHLKNHKIENLIISGIVGWE